MDIIPFLFGVSIGLIVVPFLVEIYLNRNSTRTKVIFPYSSDYWTKRVSQLRRDKRSLSEYSRLSKRSYLNEYK